jgi:hypothetical protein
MTVVVCIVSVAFLIYLSALRAGGAIYIARQFSVYVFLPKLMKQGYLGIVASKRSYAWIVAAVLMGEVEIQIIALALIARLGMGGKLMALSGVLLLLNHLVHDINRFNDYKAMKTRERADDFVVIRALHAEENDDNR